MFKIIQVSLHHGGSPNPTLIKFYCSLKVCILHHAFYKDQVGFTTPADVVQYYKGNLEGMLRIYMHS